MAALQVLPVDLWDMWSLYFVFFLKESGGIDIYHNSKGREQAH